MDNQLKKQIFSLNEDKLGSGEILCTWQPTGKWLACVGETKVVIILDLLGKIICEYQLSSLNKIKSLEFNSDGDTLAVLQENYSKVSIISIHSRKPPTEMEIERNNNDKPTCIKWSIKESYLAVCTSLGLIYIFNKMTNKIIPCAMCHSKPILSCDWNEDGNLVTSSEDKSFSVIGKLGNAVLQGIKLKEIPKQIRWMRGTTTETKSIYNTISTILGSKSILIYDTSKTTVPYELGLNNNYGNIIKYELFGESYIAVAFTKGSISILSTNESEIKNQIKMIQPFKSGIDDISICNEVNRLAVAGENSVKVYDLRSFNEIEEEKIEIPFNSGRIIEIKWSSHGNILLITTNLGRLYAFNIVVTEAYAQSKNLFTSLWSLNEACVFQVTKEKVTKLYNIQLEDEPQSLALSKNFFIANFGMSLKIYKNAEMINYQLNSDPNKSKPTCVIKEYTSNISHLSINNESMAVLSEGRIYFSRMDGEYADKIFPLKDTEDKILKSYLTDEFLFYTDSTNKLKTYQISQVSTPCVAEYRFDNPINKIFPNEQGSKLICIDNHGKAYYYSPINEKAIVLSNENEISSVIWDVQDQNFFVVLSTSGILYAYIIYDDSLNGPQVILLKEYSCIEDINESRQQICAMKLENGCYPFLLSNGFLYYFFKSSKEIKGSILLSHYWIYNYREGNDSEDAHKKYFMQCYQLAKFWNCIKSAEFLENKDLRCVYLNFLGKECLKYLEIDCSEEAFRLSGNISLCLTVEKLRYESEKKILLGHIAAILGEENKAEELFKSSSQPSLSVDLRCDLQDWVIALKLSKEYQPYREVFISKKLAFYQESNNNASEAIKMYEKSKIQNILSFISRLETDITNTSHRNIDTKDLEIHNIQCDAGIARCCIRLGDTSKAMEIASRLKDKKLIIEIAALAEQSNYNVEAAKLYTMVGLYEKAVTIYIDIKQFKSAEDLIDKVKNTNLLVQLAKMKENEKMYKDAEMAYERAGDWESVIRLNLQYLNNLEKAKEIVLNKHKTESSALMIAEYFEKMGRKKEIIEFKLIAKKYDEAFAIAQTFGEMDTYSNYISRYIHNKDEFKKIAIYYEGKSNYGKSGEYYQKAGLIEKALDMYIKSNDDEFLEKAVEMIGNQNDNSLTSKLIDYLLINNIESGPHFLIKLYIFQGNYAKACEIGVELSHQEQILSNYKSAHKILWDVYLLLKAKNLPVSYECNHRLAVLHSYLLAKNRLIKYKMNLQAARNFLRVANNIQMFEKYIVEILINVCLICNEAKLSKSASEWAFTLYDNEEYRNKIHSSFKEQIGSLARHAYKYQDEEYPLNSPCPFCKSEVPEYNLNCSNCYNVIPFCIASGKHIVLYDLYTCPECNFPSIGKEFKSILNKDPFCPLCDKELDIQLLEPVKDPIAYLKSRKIAKLEDKQNKKTEDKTDKQ